MEQKSFYFEHKDKLNEEYRKTFEKIEDYCQLELLDGEPFEDSMNYLIDVFLTAQDKGVPVKKITGNNIESFCKSFISDIAHKSLPFRILKTIESIAGMMIFLMLLLVVLPQKFFDGVGFGEIMKNTSDYISPIIIGAIGASIANILGDFAYKRIIFKLKKYRKFYHLLLNFSLTVVCCVLVGLVQLPADINGSMGISNGTFLMIGTSISGCCYIIRGFINITNGKTFFNQEKGSFINSVMRNMAGEFKKMYERDCTRRTKQGKSVLTQQEYMDKIIKETNGKIKIASIISCAATAAFYILMCVQVAITSALFDAVTFCAFMTVVYLLIMWPLVIYPYLARRKFIGILQKNNKTIFDEDVLDYIK